MREVACVSRPQNRVVDHATGERRYRPIQIERLRQAARMVIHVVSRQQHGSQTFAGLLHQVSVSGDQHAAFRATLIEHGGIRRAGLGERCVIAGGAEPAREAGKHLVAQETQPCGP